MASSVACLPVNCCQRLTAHVDILRRQLHGVAASAGLLGCNDAQPPNSAVIYSLVQTAKANGVEPYAWLRRVLRDLPAAQTVEAVEALLPWNLRTPEILANAGS